MEMTNNNDRGEQTRSALISAAMAEFGRSGFDAASTRAIAAGAGVNQALIGYHFGGKRGLYLAVFEHIAGRVQAYLAPVAERLADELDQLPEEEQTRREAAVAMLLQLFDAFLGMLGNEESAAWVLLIVREQKDPTDAFDLIYDRFMGRTLGLLCRLVGVAGGMDPASDACRVRTLMVFGQVIVFQVARSTAARHLAWTALSAERIELIKEQFRACLESQFLTRVPC
jgi:AcrR family transcriptional regulator